MKIVETRLPGVLVIEPKVFGDERGFFLETHSDKRYNAAGVQHSFVQDNHSRSSMGVLRGLHFQLNKPQGKLVRVVRGSVFDVAVDIRIGSPTFGQAAWVELTEENKRQFWVPPGFAHGFLVTSEFADFEYKCTDYYDPEDEGAIAWNDTDIKIPWPLKDVSLSHKDSLAVALRDVPAEQLPKYKG